MASTHDQQTVQFAGAGDATASGLLTLPSQDARGVVTVVPPVFGVNDYVAGIGAQLADHGYASIAIDYWNGEGPPDLSAPEHVMKAVGSVSDPGTIVQASGAIAELRARTDAGLTAAVLGFCMGGSIAIGAAADPSHDLGCVIAFYGILRYGALSDTKPRSPLDLAEEVHCPLLAHFGAHDHLIPGDDITELDGRLSGKVAEVYTYPGAGHAFHEDFRPPVFRPVAATEAWRRTLVYLDTYVGQTPES